MPEPKKTPAKAPEPKAAVPDPDGKPKGAGINASITGDLKGPRQEPDLPDDDPGINANVVS
jgi:hypothetical protein